METSTLFNDKADLYAAARPMYPKALFHFVASLVQSHDEAWDCATGNGQAAIGLADYFTKVEATDISQEQIANAFCRSNVDYSVQPAESTTYKDSQFDLVNVAQALHWFDCDRFWDEVRRVLKPEGAFVTYSYVWPHIDVAIDQILDDTVKRVIEPYWAPNNKLVWEAYRSLDLPFEPLETPLIELENHWDFEQFLNYIHTWSGTRRCMESRGPDFFETARKALGKVWGDPTTKRVVKSPLTIIAGYAWS